MAQAVFPYSSVNGSSMTPCPEMEQQHNGYYSVGPVGQAYRTSPYNSATPSYYSPSPQISKQNIDTLYSTRSQHYIPTGEYQRYHPNTFAGSWSISQSRMAHLQYPQPRCVYEACALAQDSFSNMASNMVPGTHQGLQSGLDSGLREDLQSSSGYEHARDSASLLHQDLLPVKLEQTLKWKDVEPSPENYDRDERAASDIPREPAKRIRSKPGPNPAEPASVLFDADGKTFLKFLYKCEGVNKEWRLNVDLDGIKPSEMSAEWREEHAMYPRAFRGDSSNNRHVYESQVNELGWSLIIANPGIENKRGLIQRAAEQYRNTNADHALRSRRVRREIRRRQREAAHSRSAPRHKRKRQKSSSADQRNLVAERYVSPFHEPALLHQMQTASHSDQLADAWPGPNL